MVTLKKFGVLTTLVAAVALGLATLAAAQQLAKRLILKDGSYQLVTKYEVKGDRVRYLSAERGEWEELPKSLVDWEATEKHEKDRAAGVPSPEAAALDKELEAEKHAEEVRNPHVAPGLQLPDEGGVILLDTFESQPQLVELLQSGGEVNRNMKGNIFRAAINPIASAKQTVELAGALSKVQSHVTLPSIYVNADRQDQASGEAKTTDPELPYDRFKIVRMQVKGDKRIVGDIKIAVYGKVSQAQKLVPTHTEKMTGGWVKVTPVAPLTAGEYAVVEMLGKDGMNLYVWDFGVNPSAAANPTAWKPERSAAHPPSDAPAELNQRDKQ
jgi:hypothetical protein